MDVLNKGTYSISYARDLIITDDCYFTEWSLSHSENLVIFGGHFGMNSLANSRNVVVYGGKFEPYSFMRAENVHVINGDFDDSCFLAAKDIKVLGGNFGENSFYCGEKIKGYSNGSIKSIANVSDTLLVVKTLNELIYEYGLEQEIKSVKIYAVNTHKEIKNHLIKISEKDFNSLYAPVVESLDDRIKELLQIVE